MKCCPTDKNIKKYWMEKLESESNNLSKYKYYRIESVALRFLVHCGQGQRNLSP